MAFRAFPVLLILSGFISVRQPVSAQSLPPITVSYASYAVTAGGRVIGYFGEQRRVELQSMASVPKHFIEILLSTEDRDFYNHNGVSVKGLGRALWQTLTGNTQGGSTLTMQLAKNLFLTGERSVERKLTEMNLAVELEKKYSKQQILLLYLNTVYFGRSVYGLWAAAQEYFSTTPEKLTVAESALLVGLLKAPSGYDPVTHADKALKRRNEVLYNMVETGRMSAKECARQRALPLGLRLREPLGAAYAEQVRREAADIVASMGGTLQHGQYRITVALDADVQRAAEQSMRAQWKLFPAELRAAEIGLVTIDVHSGAVLAILGGNEASGARGFNRATQMHRQPGSAFKPFLYASLLERGYTLATPVADAPLVVDSGLATEWRPQNDDGGFSGRHVAMRDGIRHSLNAVAAHAMVELTNPAEVAAFAHRCGIRSALPEVPSLALGTGEVSPLEMASAFGTFACGGLRVAPRTIASIEDKQGRTVWSPRIDTLTAIDSATAWLITDALQGVVDSGTARSVRASYQGPAAGKTGTTQNSTDAWFVGYTPRLSTAIWIGFDAPSRHLSGTYRYGGTACAPIWGRMMQQLGGAATGGAAAFQRPATVADMPICTATGRLARSECPSFTLQPVSTLHPPEECGLHDGDILGP